MAERSIVYRFTGSFGNLRTGLSQMSRQVDDVGDRLTRMDRRGRMARRGLTTIGDTAGRVALVIGAGLAASAKAAIDWESAWAGVTKTVDGSADQLERLEEDLREMARTMPATHEEIAATAQAAGQLGVATEDVADFTETMIMLGETTNLTSEQAATSIARLTNVMQSAPDDVDNIGAALVDLGNNSATTEAEILELGQRLAAAGAIAGLSEADVLGFAATLTSVGVRAEAGGTALSKVFTSVRDATLDGGDALETYAEVAGTTVDEFSRRFEEDAAGAIALFIEGLGEMNARGESTSQVFDDLGLADQRLMRALLSTAEAGDLLSESIDRGGTAFEENTALIEEYEKRVGTTGSEVRIAWNNIKDAGIEAGEALLPIVSEAADVVADLASAFGSLPGPVKDAATGLAGITAVFGGGLWFTSKVINGIVGAREALGNLGVTGGRTAGKLRRIGRVAAGISATALALNALADAMPQSGEIDSSDVLRDLEAFADGRNAAAIDNLVVSLGKLDHQGDNIFEGFRNVFTLWGKAGTATWEKAAEEIDKVDQALASMVESGDVDKAEELFDGIIEKAEDSGISADEARGEFDSYRTALDNAEASSKEAGDTAEQTAPQFKEQSDAVEEARDAARETAEEFVNLGDSVDDTEVSLSGWIKELRRNARALRDFRINAETAAERGLDQGLIASLNEAGEAGALRMGQLANATDREIRRANRAWRAGQRQVGLYSGEIEGVPENVNTRVRTPGLSKATRRALGYDNAVRNIPTSWQTLYTINTRRIGPHPNTGGALGGGLILPSDGATVPGRRSPYRDQVPALLAPGEEVISNRSGQADRWRPLLKAINDNQMANGGTVRIPAGGGGGGSITPGSIAAAMGGSPASAEEIGRAFLEAFKAEGLVFQVGDDASAKIYARGRDRAQVRS